MNVCDLCARVRPVRSVKGSSRVSREWARVQGECRGECRGESRGVSRVECRGESRGESTGESRVECRGESRGESRVECRGGCLSTRHTKHVFCMFCLIDRLFVLNSPAG